jgi:hypothetical protein
VTKLYFNQLGKRAKFLSTLTNISATRKVNNFFSVGMLRMLVHHTVDYIQLQRELLKMAMLEDSLYPVL